VLPTFKNLEDDGVHIVLLGDSTLDNGRYLDLAHGELSVEKQITKRCIERGWAVTVLAQDGSMLQDVRERQLPLIPEAATHIILSASGNDLLSLLNQMVVANFTLSSMYATIGTGLNQVSDNYKNLLQELKGLGCHLACCTLYRPNFNHLFFKSLATFSLGLHNNRIKQISVDLDCSLIDFANMFDGPEDFANPLELSSRGGSKAVENIASWVVDFPISRLHRREPNMFADDEQFTAQMSTFGMPLNCCATRTPHRRIYSSKAVSQSLVTPDVRNANGSKELRPAMEFSEAQQKWRDPAEHTTPPGQMRLS